jgi:hypothetical protein
MVTFIKKTSALSSAPIALDLSVIFVINRKKPENTNKHSYADETLDSSTVLIVVH